jgi:hypothetical protein
MTNAAARSRQERLWGVHSKSKFPAMIAARKCVNVCNGSFRPLNALRTGQQVFLNRGELSFVYHQSKVVTF